MKYSQEFLTSQSRKQLQSLAKENCIKANGTNVDIILALQLVISDCEEETVSAIILKAPEFLEIGAPTKLHEDHREEKGNEVVMTGSHIEVLVDSCWIEAVVKKINLKTYRVSLISSGSEMLIRHENVRLPQSTTAPLSSGASGQVIFLKEQSCSAVNLIPQKVEQSGPQENSVKRKRSYSNSLPIASDTTISAETDKVTIEENKSETKQLARGSHEQQLQQELPTAQLERRKAQSSNTPVKSLSRPSILPKATKTQLVRQEALSCQRERLENARASIAGSSNSNRSKAVRRSSCTPLNRIVESVATIKSLDERIVQKPESRSSVCRIALVTTTSKSPKLIESASLSSSATIAAIPLLATPSKLKNGVPDFQKMHQRMMSNLKPITAMVKRNETVDLKMTVAMVDAHKATPSISSHGSRSIGSAQIKNIVSSETKGTPSTNASSAAVPFKARTMPNFKALHGKISSKACDTPVAVDKENSSAAANNANESKRRLSGKGAKQTLVESKKNNRKESFLQGNKSMRAATIGVSRRSGPFTSTKI